MWFVMGGSCVLEYDVIRGISSHSRLDLWSLHNYFILYMGETFPNHRLMVPV